MCTLGRLMVVRGRQPGLFLPLHEEVCLLPGIYELRQELGRTELVRVAEVPEEATAATFIEFITESSDSLAA